MMGFSEYLQKFMKVNSISMVDLSEETDIDRTVIYRYVKGTRVPSDIDIVIRMADALQMSVSEKKYLIREYDKLVLGEPMVYSYQYIQKLLHSLDKLDGSFRVIDSQWRIKRELKTKDALIELKSKEEIATYIMELLCYVAESGTPEKVLLVMQPTYEEIQQFLPQILEKGNMEIEQIVCMEQNINHNYKNLDLFRRILPICFSVARYKVYYYYDSLNNHINHMTYFPNILITQNFVVQFDYKMDYGMAIQNDAYAVAARKHYQLMRKETHNLMVRGKEPEIIGDFFAQWKTKKGGVFSGQLSVGFCLDREMLENCIYPAPGKEEFIKVLLETRGEWRQKEYTASKCTAGGIVSYGSRKGVEEFMNTGCIKEFPEALCKPLSAEERKLVLQRMVLLAKEKRIRYRFLSDRVELPGGIQLYWNEGKKRLALCRVTREEILQVVVEEQSIYKTFHMYLEYLEKKDLLLGEEESLQYLMEMYQSWGGDSLQ